MTYKTLKPLYLSGVWHEAGAEVPRDVVGFDYEKAARKGILEAPEGEEVRNVVVTQQQAVAEVQPEDSGEGAEAKARAELEKQLRTAKKAAEDAEAKLSRASSEIAKLKQDSAEYQDAVGELLPEGLTAPARKALLEKGYVGKALISLLTDAQLDAVSGVAAASIETLREWVPFAGVVPAEPDSEGDAGTADPAAEQ